ncbi:hypothetical protein C7446_2402 [Kushneria sinocarnis]|uniref:SapC protein n=1 Tax=Kushneria sinocarnis TaxID=595502 RepID=A0A420WVS8_9GAMM|nr:hypothetical protein [Kushneria sinocarnis]RKR02681.1 hypothetical protein C7446_2402 [Kushneria sinocarnis]
MSQVMSSSRPARVIDMAAMRERLRASRRIVRLAPELDGLEMLYRLSADEEAFYTMPVLAWAMRGNGEVVGMVPWLDTLRPCHEIDDPEHGCFVGYRDPETEELLDAPPAHKLLELEHAAAYFDYEPCEAGIPLQLLPDTQGTHALCHETDDTPWQLKQVHGWQLRSDGRIEALLLDESQPIQTPVLPGDDCLYAAEDRHSIVYFFQRAIANRIREQDPETLEALAMMVESA